MSDTSQRAREIKTQLINEVLPEIGTALAHLDRIIDTGQPDHIFQARRALNIAAASIDTARDTAKDAARTRADAHAKDVAFAELSAEIDQILTRH